MVIITRSCLVKELLCESGPRGHCTGRTSTVSCATNWYHDDDPRLLVRPLMMSSLPLAAERAMMLIFSGCWHLCREMKTFCPNVRPRRAVVPTTRTTRNARSCRAATRNARSGRAARTTRNARSCRAARTTPNARSCWAARTTARSCRAARTTARSCRAATPSTRSCRAARIPNTPQSAKPCTTGTALGLPGKQKVKSLLLELDELVLVLTPVTHQLHRKRTFLLPVHYANDPNSVLPDSSCRNSWPHQRFA